MSKYQTRVHVKYSDGKNAKNMEVCLSMIGFLNTEIKYGKTDSRGIATIDHLLKCDAKVIVKGKVRAKISVPGQATVFI